MRTLNLDAYGVAAMSEAQMQEVNGGCWICEAISAFIHYLIDAFC